MTQREQILTMLEEAGDRGVTGNTFYANFLPRFAARIHELKKQGHDIRRFPTEEPNVFLYRLVGGEGRITSTSRAATPPSGQSAQRAPVTDRNGQVGLVAGESSNNLGPISPSSLGPKAEAMAASEPDAGAESTDATGQITDAPESRDGSGALLLFEIPVSRWADAA